MYCPTKKTVLIPNPALSKPLRPARPHATTFSAATAHRLAFSAPESVLQLGTELAKFGKGEGTPFVQTAASGLEEASSRVGDKPKVAFLFTGQGSQYAGMGK